MNRHSLEQILECTLHCCNITREEWQELGSGRKGTIARVKQLVSFIASNEGYRSSEIAEFFGLHRTTAIHNIKILREQIAFYRPLQGLVDRIVEKLGPLPGYQKQMVRYGWLARSATGLLTISPQKPERLGGYWMADGAKPCPADQFPQVTYETGPVKVKIKVTIEDHE